MRTFFTNSIGETAVVRIQTGARGQRVVEQALTKLSKVSHVKLAARFDGFERWILLDDDLNWHDVLVEYDEDGFFACETGKTAMVGGQRTRPEDVVQHVLLTQSGFNEGETRAIGRTKMVIE